MIGASYTERRIRNDGRWWSESDSPRHAERLNAYVDLAAEMGWEYSLVDANWKLMESGRIEDVLAHARDKGVSLLFWYNSGGPHNDVTEAPRDRMHARDVRRAEFPRLKQWGVKGVKIDFWHSDKQDRIRQYREVLEDAADARAHEMCGIIFPGRPNECQRPNRQPRSCHRRRSCAPCDGAGRGTRDSSFPEGPPAGATLPSPGCAALGS